MQNIKIILPKTEQDYINGYGESIWVLVNDETKAAHDRDETGGHYSGILDNYSIEYPNLKPGHVIPFEMRGEQKPVAFYDWLKDHKKPKRETYTQMNYRHQKYINTLPVKFAFSKEQYKKILDEWGITEEEAHNGVIKRIGGGGYIKAADEEMIINVIRAFEEETAEAIKADETGTGFIYEMFLYELQNHEFIITQDTAETLDALNITEEDIQNSTALKHGLYKAISEINAATDPYQ